MKVDLSKINQDEFFMRPCKVAGVDCVLVEPHGVGVVKWTRDNLIFRSSIWTTDGELVSAGFPKFFNWDEDLDKDGNFVAGKIPYPKPKTLKGAKFLDKLDGSLLIISKFRGELVIRTRGTISAEETLSNGNEIAFLKELYPNLFGYFDQVETANASLLCEWYSPLNKIVLNYGDEPRLWLIGAIHHENYALWPQQALDFLGDIVGVPRPEYYSFDSLEQMRACVAALEGKEGVCVYYNNDQNILKSKSPRYWHLHYCKTDVATVDKVIDFWMAAGQPKYADFYKLISEKYDWEIAEYCKGLMSKVCDASKEVENIVAGFKNFLTNNNLWSASDKDAYAAVSAAYGKTNRCGMVMNLKKGKPVGPEAVKKLICQLTKR